MRRQPGQLPVLPADMARADRIEAEDRPQQAGFADAVAAENAGHFAFLRGQADPAERMAGAVIKIDRLDREHRSNPPSSSRRRPGSTLQPLQNRRGGSRPSPGRRFGGVSKAINSPSEID